MQTVITNLTIERTFEKLLESFNRLNDTGVFFAIISAEYDDNGNVKLDFLDVIAKGIELGYEYVNTIVYPTIRRQEVSFSDNVKYVVWLCKNHARMKFNKDAIREKHIWKDVEWGKRAKNYNPKGKDPGNVWIPTEDDGKANIVKHILLDDHEVIARLISMSECRDDFVVYEENLSFTQQIQHDRQAVHGGKKAGSKASVYFASSESMNDVVDHSVKLIVTSPPYWNLKDYYKEGQIGQETYDVYLKRVRDVWRQCYKKLADNGSLWININIRVQHGEVICLPHDFVKTNKNIGFFYKGVIIWHKSSGIPTTEKNIVDRHEYVLVFSKQSDFCVNNYAFSQIADYRNNLINGGAFWNINRKAGSVGKQYIHPAIFPNGLAERIVEIATEPGDTVLDPFLGSGTSLIAASKCCRDFIGYEYNEGFKELMLSRFSEEIPSQIVNFL